MIWTPAHRFDKRACALADRHYNRQKVGSPQMMPPGSCRVLVANNSRAVFGLSVPKAEYVKHAWAGAWVCSIFRRHVVVRAHDRERVSDHVRCERACAFVALGCITFVDPKKVPGIPVRGERIKGFCFHMAGFELVGETKKGLLAWQLLPSRMPAPRALGGQPCLI